MLSFNLSRICISSEIYRSTCELFVFDKCIQFSFFTEPTPSNLAQHLIEIKCSAIDLSEHVYSFNADDVEENVIGGEIKFSIINRMSPNDTNQLSFFVTSNAYMPDSEFISSLGSEFECDASFPLVSQKDVESSRNTFLRKNGRRYVILEFYSYIDHHNASLAFKNLRMPTKPVIMTISSSNIRLYCVYIIENSSNAI